MFGAKRSLTHTHTWRDVDYIYIIYICCMIL